MAKEDFIELFRKVQELIPFDYASAMLGYRNSDGISVVDSINVSYPERFYEEYKSRKYSQVDAIVKQNFTTYTHQHWCIDGKRERARQPEELISFAVDFGMREGHAHGSRPFGTEKRGSLFTFASCSPMKPDMRTDIILELLIPHLHLVLSKVCGKKQMESNGIVLSAREKEVLEWVKEGKSSWDVSVILRISESTVNFHIYNIMQKLGTINRPQSVAVASRLGLIDID